LATKWEWDKIRRLAAVVVIQTFLNFFLERDLEKMERHETRPQGALDEAKQ